MWIVDRDACVFICLSTGRERCILRNWLMGQSRLFPKDGKAEMKSMQPVNSVELDSPPVLCGVVSSPASPGNSETRFSFISGKNFPQGSLFYNLKLDSSSWITPPVMTLHTGHTMSIRQGLYPTSPAASSAPSMDLQVSWASCQACPVNFIYVRRSSCFIFEISKDPITNEHKRPKSCGSKNWDVFLHLCEA